MSLDDAGRRGGDNTGRRRGDHAAPHHDDTSSAQRPPREAGLQGERTSLAWTRTALAVLVNGALMLRTGVAAHTPLVIGAGALLVVAAGGVAVAGRRRSAALLHEHDARGADRLVAAVFAVALLCAVMATGVVAFA
jgi:uncharacterized membrane protein YidH (DUF202 family)